MSFFQVRSVATIVTGKPCTRFVRRPAIIPNSSSIFTREVTVHSLEASVGMVIRRTNILHPDRATNHEHDTRSNNNSNHLRRQTVTRWDDALLVLCGRSEGNSSVIFVNSRVLIRHHCSIRLHSSLWFVSRKKDTKEKETKGAVKKRRSIIELVVRGINCHRSPIDDEL